MNSSAPRLYIDRLVQDSSISTANIMKILQSCTKSSTWWCNKACSIIPTVKTMMIIDHDGNDEDHEDIKHLEGYINIKFPQDLCCLQIFSPGKKQKKLH